jgi:hypothetical protein
MWDYSASNFVALGAGMNGEVMSMALAANGDLYAGGFFTTAGGGAALFIAKWNGAAWSAVGAGFDNAIYTVEITPNGNLYVGGLFHNVAGGGIPVSHIAVWNGAAWAVLGVGVDNQVSVIASTPQGHIYVGGYFHNAGGAGALHIAEWDGVTWSTVGGGADGIVAAIAIAPNGEVFIGGYFSNVGSPAIAAKNIARWNGSTFRALGAGVTSTGINNCVLKLVFDDHGALYALGDIITADGRSTPMNSAVWSSDIWLPGWCGSTNSFIYDLVINANQYVIAGFFTGATTPGVTHISTTCTARSYPIFTITGPGRLLYLINYTTDQVIYFDITLVASEILTIDLRPGYKTVTSSFLGNLISGVLAGSLINWYLAPGANHIGCYVDNPSATGAYTYVPLSWSID